MIQIKPLNISMVPAFVDTHLSCFHESYHNIYASEVFDVRKKTREQRISHIKARLQESKDHFYCALCDDFAIVGILIFSVLDGKGLLDALYLKKEYCNQGYGTKMLQVMELTFQKLGIEQYFVYVSSFISANTFFQKRHALYVRDEPISIHGKDYIEHEYVVKVGANI